MSNNYPDVNKNWINDNNLCWAAASANALVYSGWNHLMGNITEYQIFDIFKNSYSPGIMNQGHRPHTAIDWLLNDYYQLGIPVTDVIQKRSPHDIVLFKEDLSVFRQGGCGILYIAWDLQRRHSHVITFYDVTVTNSDNDPRSVYTILSVNSDDHVNQTFNQRLTFDVSKRFYTLNLRGLDGYVFGWWSVQPYNE
ncbi:MAG: hypothetical protein IJJ20_09635 [Thermoguttaceae bacterium]|nr:hypothetical protein [Thermoguttaceae bacterium]